jgi:hypothetical protein
VNPIIAFVSDFGLDDAWVGVCHAVIIKACPQARVVDLSHYVPAFDIRKGATIAAAGVYQLPDAIHLVVVDPGVGGVRDDLCLVTAAGTRLIGPNNGVLMAAAERAGGIESAWAIDPLRLKDRGPPATFHARDVLAPAAAALACGVAPSALGAERTQSELVAAPFGLAVHDGSFVIGEVLEADRFGSLRFNVPTERLDELGLRAPRLEVGLGHSTLHVPFGTTFTDVPEGEPVALVDSSGWLTLALNKGSAADRYGTEPGTLARLRPME